MTKSITDFDIKIGSNIVKARKAHGMTRKDLAENLGITHQQLQKYENGINRISASRLLEISRILNLDILYFYNTDRSINSLKEDGKNFISEQAEEIATLASKIKNKKKLDAVKNLIKSLGTDDN